MDKEIEEKALQALARQRKQYARQNKYIAENYERQTVILKKGPKEAIREKSGGEPINKTINKLIDSYLGR